jgi:hypothetical protein
MKEIERNDPTREEMLACALSSCEDCELKKPKCGQIQDAIRKLIEKEQPTAGVALRPAVKKFAEAMERELRKEPYKEGWDDNTPREILPFLQGGVNELWDETMSGKRPRLFVLRNQSTFVAVLAMIIFDNAGRKS